VPETFVAISHEEPHPSSNSHDILTRSTGKVRTPIPLGYAGFYYMGYVSFYTVYSWMILTAIL
jgi:hypothetical protein